MVFGLSAGAAFAATSFAGSMPLQRGLWIAGAVLVQMRLLANMFDGMVAIESGRASPLGELFNEVPDRISDSAVLIGLGYSPHATPAFGFAAALLAMSTAYIRAAGKVAGAPQEFCGPMAKQQRMFLATIAALFLAASPVAWQVISGISIADLVLLIIILGSFLTGLRRLGRICRALKSPDL